MKAYQAFIFVIICILGLGIIMLLFPKDGIKITDNFKLEFPTFEEMFLVENSQKLDIDSLLNSQVDIDTIIPIDSSQIIQNTTQIDNINAQEIKDTINNNIRFSLDKIQCTKSNIIYPKNNKNYLNPFFNKLSNTKRAKKLRIMHYGDSQIEGDRISSFLRYKLQSRYGGKGMGLNTVGKVYYQFSCIQSNSDNWDRHTSFNKRNKSVTHTKFGVMIAFSKYTALDKVFNDSTAQPTNAWIAFNKSDIAYKNTQTYNRVRLFYSDVIDTVYLKIVVNNDTIKTDKLLSCNSLQEYIFETENYIDNIEFHFSSVISPNFYGVSLEDKTNGVFVDNIALRGSSGTFFKRQDQEFLSEMFNKLNPDLMLLQFGGNSVPYIKDSVGAERYSRYISSQIYFLKTILPNTQFIFIGPSDMSVKDKDKFITYPLLPYIIDELKNTCNRSNIAYYDIYSFMGGLNSMNSWVEAEPPLAAKDYTHFTYKGAKLLANDFYNSLIIDFSNFIEKNK